MAKNIKNDVKNHSKKQQWLYGQHAVVSALKAGRRKVEEILLADAEKHPEINKKWPKEIKIIPKELLDKKFPNQVHQGIAALFSNLPTMDISDIWHENILLALDQITDPHNLGAILRSADAFGCGGVLIPTARTANLNEIVAKTACGAMETVPVVEVNLAQAIDKLKQKDYWIAGLEGTATMEISELPKNQKICLVMGSEGQGLRQLVASKCDYLVKLPMVGTVESLNVSVATGISLYEISRKQTIT